MTVEGVEIYNIYILVKENIYRAIAAVVHKIPKTKNVIVMGDFNQGFKWNSKGETRLRLDDWAKEIQLLNNLEILTRGIRTLDFTFSNND